MKKSTFGTSQRGQPKIYYHPYFDASGRNLNKIQKTARRYRSNPPNVRLLCYNNGQESNQDILAKSAKKRNIIKYNPMDVEFIINQ